MKRLLLLTAILLSGCENTSQFMHLANDYRNEYRPFYGDFDSSHFQQNSYICDNKANIYEAEVRARQEMTAQQNPNYDCNGTKYGSNVQMNCKADSSQNAYTWSETMANINRNTERANLKRQFHQSCMAENGYKLERVCFRNCGQPNQFEEKRTVGIDFEDLTVEERSFLRRNTGVKIVNIRLDSPAYYANVLVGDYLISLDDQPIANVAQAMKMAQAIDWSKRSKTVLVVIRDNQEIDIEVDLASDRR